MLAATIALREEEGAGARPMLSLVEGLSSYDADPGEGRRGTIGIVIADGRLVLRAGFRALLEDAAGIEVLGDAGDSQQALALARRLRPSVMLIDADLPGQGGAAAARRILAHVAGVRIVMLAADGSDAEARAALRAGASGVLPKDAGPAELADAVRAAAGAPAPIVGLSGVGQLDPRLGSRRRGTAALRLVPAGA